MGIYKRINCVEIETKTNNNLVVSNKKLNLISLVFVGLLSFCIMGLSLSSLGLSNEVKNITSSWSPNISDLGKLKFVNKDEDKEKEVFTSVTEMCLPFENCYITELQTGSFKVDGLGGIIVKSCLAGKVEEIENCEQNKTIIISHGKGLSSVYEYIETVGVKEGDYVEKNSPIGVCSSSVMQFKILYKNKTISGLTVKDGELTFI